MKIVISTLTGASTIAVAVTGVRTSPILGATSFFRPPILVGMGGRFLGGTVLLKTLLLSLLSAPEGFELDADDDVAADEAVVSGVEIVVTIAGLGVAVGERRGGGIAFVVIEGTESNPLTA